MKLPITNKMPGAANPEDAAPGRVFKGKQFRRIAQPRDLTRKLKYMPTTAAVTMPSVSSHWKIPVPCHDSCRQAFRQVEGHNHSDQTGAYALQQTPKYQRLITMGKCDDRNAANKQKPAERHQRLASDPVRQRARKQGRDHATEEHGGNHDRQLARIQPGVASR